MRRLRYAIVGLMLLGVCGFVFHAARQARESARATSCRGYLCNLQHAVRTYALANGHFPPAYVLGPDGKPWHSWRVLILPYLEENSVYEKYRFDEPWNGPNNRLLADDIHVELFQCPSGLDREKTLNTNYVVVVGDETIFPGSETTTIPDIRDGEENTILLVEVGKSDIHWMEPRDLDFDALALEFDPDASSSDALSSPHPAGPAVVFADTIATYRLRPPIDETKLRALLTRAGGETVGRDAVAKLNE